MNEKRNCGTPYPVYPMPISGVNMPMPFGTPTPYMSSFNPTYETDNSLNQRINSLEQRVSNLENLLSNSSYSNTSYNKTNYQMM